MSERNCKVGSDNSNDFWFLLVAFLKRTKPRHYKYFFALIYTFEKQKVCRSVVIPLAYFNKIVHEANFCLCSMKNLKSRDK